MTRYSYKPIVDEGYDDPDEPPERFAVHADGEQVGTVKKVTLSSPYTGGTTTLWRGGGQDHDNRRKAAEHVHRLFNDRRPK